MAVNGRVDFFKKEASPPVAQVVLGRLWGMDHSIPRALCNSAGAVVGQGAQTSPIVVMVTTSEQLEGMATMLQGRGAQQRPLLEGFGERSWVATLGALGYEANLQR